MPVRKVLGVVVAGAMLALGGTWAWACVPQPYLSLQPLSSGPPGTRVTVEGLAFPGPVELRWNAIDGVEVGRGAAGSFSVEVVVPKVPEGLYGLLGVVRGRSGDVGIVARTVFQVTETSPRRPGARSKTRGKVMAERHQASPGTSTAGRLVAAAGLLGSGMAGGVLLGTRRRRTRAQDHG